MEKQTRVDKTVNYVKNNRILSAVIVISLAVVAVGNLTDAVYKITKIWNNNKLTKVEDANSIINADNSQDILDEKKYIDAIIKLSETVNRLSQDNIDLTKIAPPCPFEFYEDLESMADKLRHTGSVTYAKILRPETYYGFTHEGMYFRHSYEDIVRNKVGLAKNFKDFAERLKDENRVRSVLSITAHSGFIKNTAKSKVFTHKIAEVIKGIFISYGVAECRILTYGAGNEDPISNEDTKEAKQRNQRIEIKYLGEVPKPIL